MIKITQKHDCCGCGACQQACGKNCITMQPDDEGFFYPVVDEQRCVRCGACQRVCPVLYKAEPSASVSAAYGAICKDGAVREVSSSGGVFSVLAQQVLERGGVVFGAAFAQDLSVHHIMVQRMEELPLLRGSKYVQSRIEQTYDSAKNALKAGRMVLFTGVGCQIAGLKSYLGKEYENLYTVDVLCHGVPSEKVWKTYVQRQEQRHGAKLTGVSFRNKDMGWKRYCVELRFHDGQRYCRPNGEDPYMQWFAGNISLRPSCYQCRFKEIPRVSDLTIGDAWGVERHMAHMSDDRGTSVVLVNTPKGQRLWDWAAPSLKLEAGSVDALLPAGSDARRSVRPHPNRKRFFKAVQNDPELDRLTALSAKTGLQRLLSFAKKCLKGR